MEPATIADYAPFTKYSSTITSHALDGQGNKTMFNDALTCSKKCPRFSTPPTSLCLVGCDNG